MLLTFAPGTSLADLFKAYIHGHYRRHPNGQQVWVDSYSDKRPEKHRTEFAHWQHRIEHVKDHLAQGHTREALHAFHDLGHDDSHKLARDLGLHDDGPDFADKKTLMGAIHGRLLAKKHELQAQVGRQVKADFEKRKAAGTVGKQVGKAPQELAPGKGQLHTDSQGNQFLILARPNTWNNQDAGVRYELHEKLTGADRKFHKKSVSTYALTAMRQAVTGRMQELGTQQAKVADADDSLLVTAKPGPQKVVPKKHHEKTLQEYTLERAKKNKLPADHAGNAAWARIEHREAIQRAIALGTQVAPEVVADHPELAPKADARAKDTVTMSKQELIAEHEHLVDVLKSPDHGDDLKEAKKQEKELKGYKGEDGKSPGAKDTPESLAQQKSLASFEANYEMYGTMTVQPINPVSLPDGHSLVDVGFLRIKTPPSRADSDRFRLYPAADWYRYGVAKNDQGERYTFAEYPRTYLHQGNRVLLTFDRLSGDQLDDIRTFRGLLAANRKMYERHLAPTDDMFAAPPKRGPVVVFKKPAPAS